MHRFKLYLVLAFSTFGFIACFVSKPSRFSIADSKSYEASLFRQNCAVCHGPEGDGKTLDDGKIVPSLREGELKFKTDPEIQKQITEGGNGMTPFRDLLSQREIKLMTDFVHDKVRNQ